MFSVRVFVAQNICLLYLSLHAFLCSANFFGGEFGIFWGKLSPPEVPRINPGFQLISCALVICLLKYLLTYCLPAAFSDISHTF